MVAVNICAPSHLDPCDSYGHIALELARHLTHVGVHCNLFAPGKREVENQDDELAAIVRQPVYPVHGSIMLGYPTGYQVHRSPRVHVGPCVALTMFESSKLPADWVTPLNDTNAVIVPSWFCYGVFRDAGVSVPVHVVPPGVGDIYRYHERTEGKPLTFLAFLDRGERKGGVVALQSFLRAFGEDTDYKLILKGRTPKEGRGFELSNANIEVILEDMSEAELYALYCRCDVLINPHKGEGFGLIPREFAASGGLAMTTGWSGTADDIERWGYPLPYALEQADWRGNKKFEGRDVGQWACVDPDRVASQLRIVADAWQWYRQTLPAKAQAAAQLYDWRTFAERVLAVWKGVAHG